MQQGIAHAGALGHAQCSAASGHDAALHFQLRETAIVRSHHNVSRQHQLNTQGVGDALHCHHHGFGAATIAFHAQIERVDQAQRYRFFAALHERCNGGQIETRSEVIAQGMQHTHTQRGIVV